MSRNLKVIGYLSFVCLTGVFLVACPMPGVLHHETPGTTDSTGGITGKVVAQGQTDNSGISVTAEPTDGIKSNSVQKMLAVRQAAKAAVAAQATTDAGGSYTLSGLPPEVYTLSAVSKNGLEKAMTSSVTVSGGSTAQALLMILTQTGQIQGTMTLGDGSDPTGIVVFIAGSSYSAMTDSKGKYLMSYVPAGRNYTLVASKDGYISAIRNVDVTVNKTTTLASIALAPYVPPQTTGSVSGNATLKDAPTSAGIFVYLVGTSHICVTDADGNFSLTGVSPDTYPITASKEGFSLQSCTVTVTKGNDAHISFTLTPLGPCFVTYNGNGSTGGNVPVDPTNYLPGYKVTVLGNSGSLVNTGCSFAGWNTKTDGTGFTYTPGQTFVMSSSEVMLFAIWIPVPQDNSWIIGSWVMDRPYAPYTDSTEFNVNGTAYHYLDGSLAATFGWSLNGNVLSFSDGTTHFDATVSKFSDDEFTMDMGHFYRKVPGDSIFAHAETALSAGSWIEGTITKGDMKLYSFTAPSAGSYQIAWEDSHNVAAYTGSAEVAAYKSDHVTPLFLNWSVRPQTVSLGAGEKIFAIVSGMSSGTFRIMVSPVDTSTSWMVGSWVIDAYYYYLPSTDLLVINADGTGQMLDNYDGSGPVQNGNWSLTGNALTFGGMVLTITKVNDDLWSFDSQDGTRTQRAYRKGTQPGVSVFDYTTSTPLTAGVPREDAIPAPPTPPPSLMHVHQVVLYTFTAPSAGTYNVRLLDERNSSFTARAEVSACKEDKVTTTALPVSLSSEEQIYLIVEGPYRNPGEKFNITVQLQ